MLFLSYLSSRQFSVMVADNISNAAALNYGVPQGSVSIIRIFLICHFNMSFIS